MFSADQSKSAGHANFHFHSRGEPAITQAVRGLHHQPFRAVDARFEAADRHAGLGRERAPIARVSSKVAAPRCTRSHSAFASASASASVAKAPLDRWALPRWPPSTSRNVTVLQGGV